MNFDLKELPGKFKPIFLYLRRNKKFLFFLLLISVYGWLVFRINSLSNIEPTEEAISKELQITPRLRLDENTLEKIQQLQDNSVEVQTLFKQARDNPFQE